MPRRSKSRRRSRKRYGGESIQRNTQIFSVYINNEEKKVGITVSGNSLQALYNIDEKVYGLKFNGAFNVSEKVYYELPGTFCFTEKKVVYTGTDLKNTIISINDAKQITDQSILTQLNAFETSEDAKGAVFDSIVGQCTIS